MLLLLQRERERESRHTVYLNIFGWLERSQQSDRIISDGKVAGRTGTTITLATASREIIGPFPSSAMVLVPLGVDGITPEDGPDCLSSLLL